MRGAETTAGGLAQAALVQANNIYGETLIKRWLAPPNFEGDEEKSRRAGLINATLLFIITYTTLVLGGSWIGGRLPMTTLLINALILSVCLLLRRWLFYGQVTWVGFCLISLGIAAVSASAVSVGTIRTTVSAMYLFLVVIAGNLFGRRGILAATLASSLAVGGVILAENFGLLTVPNYGVGFTQWITYTFMFGVAGYITNYALQTILDALKHTQKEVEERKRTEEALRDSEARWQFALEGPGDGVWDWNVQTNLLYYSPQWKKMLGYEADEVGNNLEEWDQRIHPDDQERVYEDLNQHLNGQTEIYASEYRLRCKDGGYIWVLDRGKVLSRSLAGKPLRVIGVHTNISERKRIEEAKSKSELRFRSLFEQTHDAVFIINLDGRHLAANQRASDMLGYSPEEMIGLSLNDISAELDGSKNVFSQLLAGESVPLFERQFRNKNGRVFPVEINAELIRDKNGRPLHIQSVVRDISERKEAEEALRAANEQLSLRVAEVEELQAELRELALHDPLTGLYNRRYLAEMLEREVTRSEREGNPLSIIVSDIDHFKDINDTYGHQVGDLFLIKLAGLMAGSTRKSDFVCRYGGEEFVLVLPGASSASAAQRAEKLRQKCAEVTIEHEGKHLGVTMSFGVASYPQDGGSGEETIIKADKALYKSKQKGRNQVTVWCREEAVIT